jgi:hypothetical protein
MHLLRRLATIGGICIGALCAGLLISINVKRNGNAYLAMALGIIGITSFLGILYCSHMLDNPGKPFKSQDVRTALAASYIVVFFSFLALFSFNRNDPSSFAKSLSDTLLTQTTLILGFYFATSGALEYARIRHGQETESGGQEKKEGPPSPSDPPS